MSDYAGRYRYTRVRSQEQFDQIIEYFENNGYRTNDTITWGRISDTYGKEKPILIYPNNKKDGMMFCRKSWAIDYRVPRKDIFTNILPKELFEI